MLKMKQYIKKAMAVLLVAMLVAGIAAPAAEAAVKKVTVTTQAELEAVLAEAAKTGEKIKIKIKSADKTTFTIPEGNYPGVKLVVKAENAKIKNYGAVKALEVKDAKKFVEFATGNTIEIEDSKVEVNVKKGASVENLKFTKAEAENTVVINGSVKKVVVAETMDMNLVVNGAVATVKVKADAELTIAGKTETAPVVKAAAEVEVKVENKTETEIVVKDAEGNETKVGAGETTEDTTTEDTGSTGGTTGGSTGGYVPTPSTPVVVTPKVTPKYENGETIYTLTGVDSFLDLKEMTVKVTRLVNGEMTTTAPKTFSKNDISATRLQKITAYYNNPSQGVDYWKSVERLVVTQNGVNITVEGAVDSLTKNVTVTFNDVTYTAEVTLDAANTKVTVKVTSGDYADKKPFVIRKVSGNSFAINAKTEDNLEIITVK